MRSHDLFAFSPILCPGWRGNYSQLKNDENYTSVKCKTLPSRRLRMQFSKREEKIMNYHRQSSSSLLNSPKPARKDRVSFWWDLIPKKSQTWIPERSIGRYVRSAHGQRDSKARFGFTRNDGFVVDPWEKRNKYFWPESKPRSYNVLCSTRCEVEMPEQSLALRADPEVQIWRLSLHSTTRTKGATTVLSSPASWATLCWFFPIGWTKHYQLECFPLLNSTQRRRIAAVLWYD